MGYLFATLGQYPKSNAYYDNAQEKNPNDGLMLANYGLSLWFQGKGDDAVKLFRESHRRNPLAAISNVARGLASVLSNDRVEARSFVERGLVLDKDSFVRWWAGATYVTMNDQESAAEQLLAALESDPDFILAMAWLALIFTDLDEPEVTDYWLSRAEQIDPYHVMAAARRADNLLQTEQREAYVVHAGQWAAARPNSQGAKQYAGFKNAVLAPLRCDEEDFDSWRDLQNASISASMSYLDGYRIDGELTVTNFNTWSFLSVASGTKSLGNLDESRQLAQAVIAWYDTNPSGLTNFKELQLAIAYALLGDKQAAIDNLNAMYESGFTGVRLIHAYGLESDRTGVFENLKDNIGFIDSIDRLKQRNKEIVRNLYRDLPQLFPPGYVLDDSQTSATQAPIDNLTL
jgi:tetratricopeptide (TPR) repeat protein